MTRRNRRHSFSTTRVAQLLANWADEQPEPQPVVYTGEAGCDFPDPETSFGIDVAVFTAETVAAQTDDSPYMVGVPLLAVEILSPSDRQEEIHAKLQEYLDGGVPLVWVVEPRYRTVTVYQPDEEPVLFNVRQELAGDPHLPGFRVPTARLFG